MSDLLCGCVPMLDSMRCTQQHTSGQTALEPCSNIQSVVEGRGTAAVHALASGGKDVARRRQMALMC